MRLAQGELRFPERTVVMVQATVGQMRASMVTLNNIAELRRPKETAEFFDSLDPSEQLEWLKTRWPGRAIGPLRRATPPARRPRSLHDSLPR